VALRDGDPHGRGQLVGQLVEGQGGEQVDDAGGYASGDLRERVVRRDLGVGPRVQPSADPHERALVDEPGEHYAGDAERIEVARAQHAVGAGERHDLLWLGGGHDTKQLHLGGSDDES
jgi:hypothetical protein